ncbi:Glyceraldehyde dehydrogenase small chain [uncultured Desulfobacterium sp.]|uniref:Glyceraldehyde dehydrogenase small chain n=1 Tax=uncultured Desulfobacterium sp. TaxID=201089 RepID=A0A445N0F7_9BACT|nr:Glyceraldehyde dehydrogenase small chain [uncultured Desulfobacterium sp.]
MKKYKLCLTVNGIDYMLEVNAGETLQDVIRDHLNLTGTKTGCDSGACGACTVLMDGMAIKSCLVLALQAEGRKILTIEGLAQDGALHPLQEAFVENWAIQCGYCTPGMILTSKALLDENPNPSGDDIRMYLSGNFCRCTGYQKIIDAVSSVRPLQGGRHGKK